MRALTSTGKYCSEKHNYKHTMCVAKVMYKADNMLKSQLYKWLPYSTRKPNGVMSFTTV